jgi:hypothetical protein
MASIINGYIADANEIMNAFGKLFKNSIQAFFDSAKNGWNSNLNSTGAPATTNFKYDVFSSQTVADINNSFSYDNTYKSYVTRNWTSSYLYYIDIEATSVTDFESINNCTLIKLDTGKWRLFSTDTSYQIARAQVLKTLFYGTDGTNPRATNNITGLSALRTPDSNDVGYIFNAWNWQANVGAYPADCYRTATFSNTTSNKAISWTSCSGASGNRYADWLMPVGTVLNRGGAVDETGTDTTAEDKTNPANCRIEGSNSNVASGFTATVRGFIGWKAGTLTWSAFTVISGTCTEASWTLTTFSGIPALTATTFGLTVSNFFSAATTSTSTITNAILVANNYTNTGSTWNYYLSANNGTNWEEVTPNTIYRFVNTGTQIMVRIKNTRTVTSYTDRISEYAVLYNWY